MSGILRYFGSVFNNIGLFFNKNTNSGESDTEELRVPIPRKRRQNENSPDSMKPKRRKPNLSLSSVDLRNVPVSNSDPSSQVNCYPNLSIIKTGYNNFKRLTKVSCVDTNQQNTVIYSIDDPEDCDIPETRYKVPRAKEKKILRETVNSEKIERNEQELPIKWQHPRFILTRIHQDRGIATYLDMMKKSAGASAHTRKSSSTSSGTVKDSRQRVQDVEDFIFSYTSPPMFPSYLHQNNVDRIDLIKDSAADKTVIDLTNEEDENQLQIIESSVIRSPRIQNFRSSLIGKNVIEADPNFIDKMVKKYRETRKNGENRTKLVEKRLREESAQFHNTLAEILEKRLNLKEHTLESEQKPSYEAAPISEDMIKEMHEIMNSQKYPLIQIKDTGVKMQDIRTLEDCAWLNDEAINAYMNLIKLRWENDQKKYPKIHCYNTFLYPQLQKKGYSSVRRWTKRVDIFDNVLVIVPIHLGNHWCLIEIRLQDKQILYYDSLGSPNNRCLETIMQYLVDEYKDKKNSLLDSSEWKLVNVSPDTIPTQKNAYDCGVFACTYAEHLTRQSLLNFDQEHMSYFRLKMMYEILTGRLLL